MATLRNEDLGSNIHSDLRPDSPLTSLSCWSTALRIKANYAKNLCLYPFLDLAAVQKTEEPLFVLATDVMIVLTCRDLVPARGKVLQAIDRMWQTSKLNLFVSNSSWHFYKAPQSLLCCEYSFCNCPVTMDRVLEWFGKHMCSPHHENSAKDTKEQLVFKLDKSLGNIQAQISYISITSSPPVFFSTWLPTPPYLQPFKQLSHSLALPCVTCNLRPLKGAIWLTAILYVLSFLYVTLHTS